MFVEYTLFHGSSEPWDVELKLTDMDIAKVVLATSMCQGTKETR